MSVRILLIRYVLRYTTNRWHKCNKVTHPQMQRQGQKFDQHENRVIERATRHFSGPLTSDMVQSNYLRQRLATAQPCPNYPNRHIACWPSVAKKDCATWCSCTCSDCDIRRFCHARTSASNAWRNASPILSWKPAVERSSTAHTMRACRPVPGCPCCWMRKHARCGW